MEGNNVIEGGGLWQGRLFCFEALPSTNTWAAQNAAQLRHGDIVTAARQTAGRGRFDRSWVMPTDSGIALTAVLRNVEPAEVRANLGRAAALAVRACLAGFSVEAQVKWPNDVMARGRKICGILAEMISPQPREVPLARPARRRALHDDDNGGTASVPSAFFPPMIEASPETGAGVLLVGIGLNVNIAATDFKTAGLDETATSMLIERNAGFDVEKVRARLVSSLEEWAGGLLREGVGSIEEAWRSCDWLDGSRVEIETESGLHRGRYCGVAPDGRLRLAGSSGTEQLFWSGDVRKVMETTSGR